MAREVLEHLGARRRAQRERRRLDRREQPRLRVHLAHEVVHLARAPRVGRARSGRCRRRRAPARSRSRAPRSRRSCAESVSSPVISRSIQTRRSDISGVGTPAPYASGRAGRPGGVTSPPCRRSSGDPPPSRRPRATSAASWPSTASTTSPRSGARSIDDPEWFWDAFVRFAGIEWTTPYTQVLDTSARHRVGDLVHRRTAERRARLRRQVGGARRLA